MEIKYYDIGVNLFCKQFSDPDLIIKNAINEGVSCILTGSDMTENMLVSNYTKNHLCFGTAGIHPHNADQFIDDDIIKLESIITQNPKIVAVGECGLDYDRMFSSKANQLDCFKKQISLAQKLKKPMFLHERSAFEDLVACFKDKEDICQRSVVHCFTGGVNELRKYLEMGFFIGITGWICDDRRAEALRSAVKELPLEKLLIETDAPYLKPRGIKGLGKINVPENIKYITRALAEHMNKSEEEIISNAKKNTEKLFSVKV